MAITALSGWSTTATSNVDLNGIPLGEGLMAAPNVNNAFQELMAQIKAGIGVSFQAYDADLAAVAGLSSTGLIARTGAGTAAVRTLTAPAAGITITNGNGVSGNPTLALADDLAALEGLSTSGIPVRTGTDTWAVRTLSAPGAGLNITNPAGTAGNPTFAVADDLAALEALSGTNTIYYRSGTSAWSAVTVGSNLTFSGGTLNLAGTIAVTEVIATTIGADTVSTPLLDATLVDAAAVHASELQVDGHDAYHEGNLLGTVSQSSGVPTGSVIQRGSNANGEYVKWADGTMIATHRVTPASGPSTANGSLFQGPATTWTFPVAFVAAPVVTAGGTTSNRWVTSSDPSTTAVSVRENIAVSSITAFPINVQAVGRWF